jgi:hypothetical protein
MGSGVTVLPLPICAPPSKQQEGGGLDPELHAWLHASSKHFGGLLRLLKMRHQQRLLQLQSAEARARASLWWPFTQHSNLGDGSITVVDSRCAGWRRAAGRSARRCVSSASLSCGT